MEWEGESSRAKVLSGLEGVLIIILIPANRWGGGRDQPPPYLFPTPKGLNSLFLLGIPLIFIPLKPQRRPALDQSIQPLDLQRFADLFSQGRFALFNIMAITRNSFCFAALCNQGLIGASSIIHQSRMLALTNNQ